MTLPLTIALAACTSSPGGRSPHDAPGAPDFGTVPAPVPDPGDPPADCVAEAAVVINELSPANVGALLDGRGESVDWLELVNADTVPVELGGWALSDDADEPEKYVLPALTLPPGAFQLVYAADGAGRASVASWDTRVDQGHTWRYLEVTAPPDPDWATRAYDDGAWASGPSGFGTGDGDDATDLEASTIYVRTTVTVTADELADLVALDLHVDYDDAFVAYLNGVEVARAGIGTPGDPPAWDASASSDHEGRLYQALPPTHFDLAAAIGLLTEGGNTLALEVHDSPSSSDLSLTPFLSLGFATERDGVDSAVLELPLHELYTGFSLRAEGERVRLYDSAGCVADDLEPEALLADQSYGRKPDGVGALGYFLEPTPGAANLTESRPGFSPTPVFDPPPGQAVAGAAITVVGGPAADLHFAWGGVEPTEDDPTWAGTQPIDPVNGTDDGVVLRVKAWEDGLWPSRVATATYILKEPGTLPVVALVTDPANLWDEDGGIYTFGPTYEPEPPYYGANFWEDWERPVHVAEWEPDGTLGFAVDAGLSIFGNKSREHGQKSLLVELGSRWGASTIEHEVFPGLGLASFDRLLLRNGGQDWLGCSFAGCIGAHLRDGLMHALTAGSDVDVLAYRPAEVYINGVYWGIYHLNERPDVSYVEAHHGYTDIDLLEQGGNAPVEGDAAAYTAMMDYLRTHDLSDPAVYAHVQTLIDVDELQAYLAFEVFYANTDWPGNNIKYWRPRTPDGRWRWMMYDTDFGLGAWGRTPAHDSLAAALEPAGPGWPNPPWSTELFRLLVTSPEFTATFVNRYADYLNTLLAPETTRATLDRFVDEIAAEVPRHEERWGSWTDGTVAQELEPGAWEAEVAGIDEWLGERPDHARQHVVEQFGLAGTFTLELAADPPGAGSFALTAVEVEAPFTGVYFQGVPVTVTAIPAAGSTFTGWSDPALGADATVTVDASGPIRLEARFQ